MTCNSERKFVQKSESPPAKGGLLSLETKLTIGWALTAGGWLISRRNQLKLEQSKNSYGHNHILNKKLYKKHIESIANRLNEPHNLTSSSLGKNQKDAIGKISFELENMALDVEQGYISEKYVYRNLKTFLERFLIVAHTEISYYRETVNSDTLDKNLEVMILRQIFYSKTVTQNLYETLFFKPNFDISGCLFASHFCTLDKGYFSFFKAIWGKKSLSRKITYLNGTIALEGYKNSFKNRIRIIRIIEYLIYGSIALAVSLAFLS
ncbi:MAG: hypothetical protein COC00_000205 [Rhizobiales bacterium]|nr:hypothetical protein [Hyphomicrobiales bacterium]